jgi:hypothetical protein
MPQLRDYGTDRLVLPSDPEAWVDMKRRASYGDKAAAQDSMMKISHVDASKLNGKRREQAMIDQQSGRAMVTDFETMAYMMTLLQRLIVAWNYTDELGHALPINRANLELLDGEDGEFLQTEARGRIGGRSTDQQGPTSTPSSPSSLAVAGTRKTGQSHGN